jgi:Tol biopolymer transport system component
MPNLPKSKLTAFLAAAVALLALPAAANATLTYTKGFNKPRVYIAQDNGKGAKQLGLGNNSRISPDGEWVVYERQSGNHEEMRLYKTSNGKSERLLGNWDESYVFAWAPDSEWLAALTGSNGTGPSTLILISLENGKRVKIASGYFNGVSFSPESDEVVYGVSKAQTIPLKSDVYKASVEGGTPTALSHDHNALNPLWGPKGEIVFARQLGIKTRQYAPANQLFVMNDEGQRISQLSHTKVDPLAEGLAPLAWSANGARLLAEFGGQDQSYAVALSAITGAEIKLTKDPESGFQGAALSADGNAVLGTTGLGFGGDLKPKVVTVPFTGGPQKVLVVGGYSPSWSVE